MYGWPWLYACGGWIYLWNGKPLIFFGNSEPEIRNELLCVSSLSHTTLEHCLSALEETQAIPSPGWTGPTPFGVPVRIKSPSSNRIALDKNAIKAGTGNIISLVFPLCFILPFTVSHRSTFSMHPSPTCCRLIGRNVSKPLARLWQPN